MSASEDGKSATAGDDKSAASSFRVSQIDHVHVFVADRRASARWYADVLGLEVCHDIESESDGGPLVVSSDGGSTGLALFRKKQQGATQTSTTVAFRVGGAGFMEFLERLSSLKVEGANGQTLAPTDVVDHDYCYSVYFNDPDGNPYELTTYDYEDVRAHLEGKS